MLHTIGRQPEATSLADLLLACHARIRRFTALAQQLARATDVPADELREAAARIRRYFAEALPHHIADEDALVPVLAGQAPEVDHALAQMTAEHADHAPAVALLVELCAEIERDPALHGRLAVVLAVVADEVADKLGAHLALEERHVLPALRRLPLRDQQRLLAEKRARRAPLAG